MSDKKIEITIGSRVRVRPGGAAERTRYQERHVVGTVVDAQDIPGYGYGIKVQWPDEEAPASFEHVGQYQLV